MQKLIYTYRLYNNQLRDRKMEDKTETRSLTMPKETWKKLDEMANKYSVINAQELIRRCIDSMIKGETH